MFIDKENMKLGKLPKNLPIEMINEVISILANLIRILSEKEALHSSESISDYQETIENLSRDLEDCINLYESWRLDEEAYKYFVALETMRNYLITADALLKAELLL